MNRSIHFVFTRFKIHVSVYLHAVDGLARPGGQVRFSECLGAGWVGVADTGNVLTGGAVLHGQGSLVDHLSSTRANDVSSQQSVCFLVTQDLDHTICVSLLHFALLLAGELAGELPLPSDPPHSCQPRRPQSQDRCR